MATKESKNAKAKRTLKRAPRADAQRNRERILEAAKDAFTRWGADASLDEIAKQARVGAGTLYRNFTDREALLEAVYRTEVQKLAAAERQFSQTMEPVEALRAWMLLFVDYIAAKHIIAPALNRVVGGPSKVLAESGELVKGAIQALAQRAVESGDVRPDLVPLDLLRALIGVSNGAADPGWQQSAKRLVEILIQGSRTTGG